MSPFSRKKVYGGEGLDLHGFRITQLKSAFRAMTVIISIEASARIISLALPAPLFFVGRIPYGANTWIGR